MLLAGLFPIFALPSAAPTPAYLTTAKGLRAGVGAIPQIPKAKVLAELAKGEPVDTDPAWKELTAGKDGWFEGEPLRGGWLSFHVSSDSDKVVLLNAQGDSFATVDGVPVAGDVYESGYVRVPVKLKAGDNTLLFRCVRGRMRVSIDPLTAPLELDTADMTLPDEAPILKGAKPASILVRNATDAVVPNLEIVAIQGRRRQTTKLRPQLPLNVTKATFWVNVSENPDVKLQLISNGKVVSTAKFKLALRKKGEVYEDTFISSIDGSAQYFAVNPAINLDGAAMALSLHGAGVEASGQARAYSTKKWISIVCPTNRRPYGYDWEDWGRMDALEVFGLGQQELHPDPSRLYLIGHSMGGHGTILNGALYPGKFAAIAPSAGWISAQTYAGRSAIEGKSASETALENANDLDEPRRILDNYSAEGIFMLQGGADDNVPPTEERTLAKLLGGFHHDFIYHEVPGQGHWWDINPEPGADAVDFSGIFDFLAKHALPPIDSVHDIDFSTFDPEISSTCYWATVDAQLKPLDVSRVQLHADPYMRMITGTTTNVARLTFAFDPLMPGDKVTVNLDGQKLVVATSPNQKDLTLEQVGGQWKVGDESSTMVMKTPSRSGPLRLGFNHKFILVYPTNGSADFDSAALDKVRYDSQTWWYRANGDVRIESDADYLASQKAGKAEDRSVIVYGNRQSNLAWSKLIPEDPAPVANATGDAAYLFIRPKAGSSVASVVALGATSVTGMRSLDFLPYLQPMVGYPDLTLYQVGDDGFNLSLATNFDQYWKLIP